MWRWLSILGRDLGVKVEIVELEDLAALPRLLASGDVDLGMAGIAGHTRARQ